MPKANKTIKIVILLAAIVAVGMFFTATKRETVGEGRVAVLLFTGGSYSVYQAGDMVTVWPIISQLVILSNKSVLFTMQGDGAISVDLGNGQKKINLGCQVRYQLTDPAKLIVSQGAEAPQQAIEKMIRAKISTELSKDLAANPQLLDKIQPRIIFVAETTHQLNQSLSKNGVSVLSFDLLEW